MKQVIFALLLALPFQSFAGEEPCEEELEGGRSLTKLVQVIMKDSLDNEKAYRLRFKAKRFYAEEFLRIPTLESQIAKFEVYFKHDGLAASGSNLIFEFVLQGHGRNLVQAIMELSNKELQEKYQLEPVSWKEGHRESLVHAAPEDRAPPSEAEFKRLMKIKIKELEFSTRVESALREGHKGIVNAPTPIRYVGDLVQLSEDEILTFNNLGRKSLSEIRNRLAEMGLKLSTEVPGWPYKDELNL